MTRGPGDTLRVRAQDPLFNRTVLEKSNLIKVFEKPKPLIKAHLKRGYAGFQGFMGRMSFATTVPFQHYLYTVYQSELKTGL